MRPGGNGTLVPKPSPLPPVPQSFSKLKLCVPGFFFFPRRMRTGHRKAILRFVRAARSGISHISNAVRPPASCGMHASDLSPRMYMCMCMYAMCVGVCVYACACIYICTPRAEKIHAEGRGAEERECLELKPKSGCRASPWNRGTSRNGERTRSLRVPSRPHCWVLTALTGPRGPNQDSDRELILGTAGRERYGMMIWDRGSR